MNTKGSLPSAQLEPIMIDVMRSSKSQSFEYTKRGELGDTFFTLMFVKTRRSAAKEKSPRRIMLVVDRLCQLFVFAHFYFWKKNH